MPLRKGTVRRLRRHTDTVGGRSTDLDLDDQQNRILAGCGRTRTVQQFWPTPSCASRRRTSGRRRSRALPRQAALQEWDACLVTQGLHRAHGPLGYHRRQRRSQGTPEEYGDDLGNDSAVVDARCKADVRLVERLTRPSPTCRAVRSQPTGSLTAAATRSTTRWTGNDDVAEHG